MSHPPPPSTSSLSLPAHPNYRGATVQDLDLPPAVSIHPSTPISHALSLSYARDFSQLTVLSESKRSLLGYVSTAQLQAAESGGGGGGGGGGAGDEEKTVESVMMHFDRRRSKGYKVITPETPLEELQTFLEGEEFAVVTDAGRRFVLGVATRGDLAEFVRRRPVL